MAGELDELQAEAGRWEVETFPGSTEESLLAHLESEVNELHVGCDSEELADVAILAMQIAQKRGLSLMKLMRQKVEKNYLRTWRKNEKGFWEHVE